MTNPINLIRDSSLERDEAVWTAFGASSSYSRGGTTPQHGDFHGSLTLGAAGSPNVRSEWIRVTPGDIYTFSTYARWGAGATPRTCRINVHFLDRAGGGVTGGVNAGGDFTPAAGSWTRIFNNDNVAPEGSYWAELRHVVLNGALGDRYDFDAMMFVEGNYDAPGPPMFEYAPHPAEAAGETGDPLTYSLNRLAYTLSPRGVPTLGAQGAANVYAGTSGLALVGALNVAAGNTLPNYKELAGVLNQLAGTTGLGVDEAASRIIA